MGQLWFIRYPPRAHVIRAIKRDKSRQYAYFHPAPESEPQTPAVLAAGVLAVPRVRSARV